MELKQFRNIINKIDTSIISLFKERMDIVKKIIDYKKNKKISIINKIREKEIINLHTIKNKTYNKYIKLLLKEIISLSKRYQESIFFKNFRWQDILVDLPISIRKENPKVSYNGIIGSFGEIAALEYFSKESTLIQCKTFEETVSAMVNNLVDYCILPIENTSSGAILETVSLIQNNNIYIVGEIVIIADQCLLGIGKIEDLEIIYSHDQGFIQCREYLKSKNWKQIEYFNTAISAEKVRNENNIKIGAIASKKAAEIYNLKILKENINYNRKNLTRFVILKKSLELNSNNNKISIEIILEDKKGSLFSIIKTITDNNLSMSKIESKPILGKPWEYVFFIDFFGNINDKNVKIALKEIKDNSLKFYFKGNYIENINENYGN